MNVKNKGIGVTVKDGENISQALRRFKRKVEEEDEVTQDLNIKPGFVLQ